MKASWALAAALALGSLTASAASAGKLDSSKLPPPSGRQGVLFSEHIQPILQKGCLDCHGPEKPKGKLRLDSAAAVLKGGEDGKVVVVGDSAKSLLVYAVARTQVRSMPPKDKGEPLSKEEVGLIRAWIDQGAK